MAYPLTVGYEIVGVVTEVGAEVTKHAVGDRVGTITQGGYSTHVVVDEDFVLRVPSSIPYEKAAPLLGAGITTYSPPAHWKAGLRVAVVGMGGLGHMAVKIAAAMGAEVTVLSQTLGKKDDGLAFGATDYHATGDPATFEALAGAGRRAGPRAGRCGARARGRVVRGGRVRGAGCGARG